MVNRASASKLQILCMSKGGKVEFDLVHFLPKRLWEMDEFVKIHSLKTVVIMDLGLGPNPAGQSVIARVEWYKDQLRVHTEYVVKPDVSGTIVVWSDQFPMQPFVSSQMVVGTWKVQWSVAQFPTGVLDTIPVARKQGILEHLSYIPVFNAVLQWEIRDSAPVPGLDETGQYVDPTEGDRVQRSTQSFDSKDI